MDLPVSLHEKIVDFLTSLPQIHNDKTQQALVYSAGLDPQLQKQIVFGGSALQFVQGLVETLYKYKMLKDGRNALEAILEAAKSLVGQDQKEHCEILLQELRKLRIHPEQQPSKTLVEQKPSETPEKERKKKPIIKFGILALVVVLSILFIAILVRDKKVYYTVKLVLPSRMSGADIYVDGQPATILEQTHTVVIIRVEKKQENHQFIAQKTNEQPCTKTQLIQKNDETIFVCQ